MTPHEVWMEDWRTKYVQDDKKLAALEPHMKGKRVRITIQRGGSTTHPDERVTTEGVVLGRGDDVVWSEDLTTSVRRMSFVLDNGHAHYVKPGMKFEVMGDGPRPRYRKVADFPLV